ncbi:hypothetical protein GCM10010168_53000 [Actinoplanes ianthinogenes]|uniref:Uncharacterized protein n=1 Tax=Actinoplanes ianthinogenes TaxID=122358 RepID=A0ABN6C8Y7_9ACTN|nr:hypothetical protein [Actinoplanes ianthinogenes]BCJ41702.1 hypothetical protein Aiant_23590 [Actinoplanes ianthinogenes]GGR28310.1 hypothetical protein GCM10010168_53000 [Actinoplanes ianthinogenes]
MSMYAQIWDTPAIKIEDAAEETAAIKEAQTGDEGAILRLFAAYVPALKAAMGTYTAVLPIDDARQAAFVGFMNAIREHEAARSERLAGAIRQHVHEALSGAVANGNGGLTVPSRTLKRAFGILKKANGDVAEGARIAPLHEMTEETFLAVIAAVRADESLDFEIEIHGDASFFDATTTPHEVTDVEDRILVEAAFRAVDGLEAEVCRLAYGFAEFNPIPDAEIGHRLGYSRLSVLRTRSRALDKMRKIICAS